MAVLKGDLALVGPRRELPGFVTLGSPVWREVLEARPGMTDPVALRLRSEERLLSMVEGDRERFYVEELLPFKLAGYIRYHRRRTPCSDLAVLVRTLACIVRPETANQPSLEEVSCAARLAQEMRYKGNGA